MDVVVGGSSISGNGRPSKSYRAGRVCLESGCGTILSIYNDGSYCSRHQPMWVPRIRGKKSA